LDNTENILRYVKKLEMRLNQKWGPLKMKKLRNTKRNLPKTPEDVKLGDQCEISQHKCILKKGRCSSWFCDCINDDEAEPACVSGYTKEKGYDRYDDGICYLCWDCGYSACTKCCQYWVHRDEHERAAEEDAEVVIIE
jgi:hypothetical protein